MILGHDRSISKDFNEKKSEIFLDLLLKNNVSLKQIAHEKPILTIAIKNNQKLNCMTKLLEHDINVNSFGTFKIMPNGRSYSCDPPIFHAISTKNDAFINLLLKYNIDFEIENAYGQTALIKLIISYCDYEVDEDKKQDKKEDKNEYKRLSYLLEKFLKEGADPNQIGVRGNKPIHYLSLRAKSKILFDVFFDNACDIDINAKNMYGNTPLILATSTNNLPGVKFLVKKGVDLDIMGQHDYTAITLAAISDNQEIFNYLLNKGADLLVAYKDKNNKNNIIKQIIKSKEYDNKKHDKYIKKISKLHPELINS